MRNKRELVLPVRTCFGCRNRKSIGELLRYTAHVITGVLVPDGKKKSVGRGVYCCNNRACLEKLIRNKKGLKKALQIEVDLGEIEASLGKV